MTVDSEPGRLTTINHEPMETEDILVCRQLTHNYQQVAMPIEDQLTGESTAVSTEIGRVSVYRQLRVNCHSYVYFQNLNCFRF